MLLYFVKLAEQKLIKIENHIPSKPVPDCPGSMNDPFIFIVATLISLEWEIPHQQLPRVGAGSI